MDIKYLKGMLFRPSLLLPVSPLPKVLLFAPVMVLQLMLNPPTMNQPSTATNTESMMDTVEPTTMLMNPVMDIQLREATVSLSLMDVSKL